jgi:peptide/nickel transport system permease protein
MRWKVFLRQPLGVVGAVVLLVLAFASLAAPWVAPFDPNAIDLRAMQRPPGGAHLLGTDDLGRDVLARLLFAGRVSLLLAFVVTAFAVAIGTALGALAGFFGGWVDRLVSLLTDALLSMPVLGLAMVAGSVLRPNLWTLSVVLALVAWPTLARITRAQVLTLRERTYAEAARALGLRPQRVLFRHLMPNAVAPLIVAATLLSAQVLLIESALSFLGYGMRPPTPSWGGMLNEAQAFYRQSPWLAVFPGVAITLTVAALNFVGDALRAATGGRGG